MLHRGKKFKQIHQGLHWDLNFAAFYDTVLWIKDAVCGDGAGQLHTSGWTKKTRTATHRRGVVLEGSRRQICVAAPKHLQTKKAPLQTVRQRGSGEEEEDEGSEARRSASGSSLMRRHFEAQD